MYNIHNYIYMKTVEVHHGKWYENKNSALWKMVLNVL